MQYVIIILVILAVIGISRWLGRGGGFALPALPRGWFLGGLASLGRFKQAITFMLVLTALWIALWMWMPDAPIFHTPEGYVHIAIYYALAALAGMVDSNLRGRIKFAAAVMLAIVFCIVGMRTGMLFHSGSGSSPLAWFSGGEFRPECPQKVHQATLTAEPQNLNPDDCFLRLVQPPGKGVAVYDKWGNLLGANYNDPKRPSHFDGKYGESVASLEPEPLPAIYVLCKQRGQTDQVVDGCP